MGSIPLFAILFDTPVGFLATAAAAASVPVIIHLLNRNRYRVVVWAAMRFLLAAQKKNTRRMRVEQLLLLAVRTLIVLLLVAAMASVMPWTDGLWSALFPRSGIFAAAAGQRTHKILVIDGSFSMAARDGDESCFDRACAAAQKILKRSPTGDGFSLVLMAAPPRRVVAEPSDDAHKVEEEVQALRLPHGNADLTATLRAVEDMLANSPTKFQEREVYFLTDLQRATWTARQPVDPAGTLQKIQARARTVLVDVGRDGVNNLAVTGLTLGVPMATTAEATPVTALLHNYGSEPRETRVELHVGQARQTAADPAFNLRYVSDQQVRIAPGQTVPVTFSHKFHTPGDYALQVRVENDALDLDDTRSAVVSVKETIPVMLVNGKPAAEVYERATEWLQDALNPFPKGQVPRHNPARPKTLTESQFADAGLGDLTSFDCVILCDVSRVGPAEIRRLETHLRKGGGVVFFLGPDVDLEAYNRLLHRNGEGLLPCKLIGAQRAPEQGFFTLFGDEEDYKHSPLDAFAADSDRTSLGLARFRQYLRVELPAKGTARKLLSFMPSAEMTSGAKPAPPSGKPKAGEVPVGDPALVVAPRYRGKVVVVTSTANMDWTSWPISPSYLPFMQELLNFAVTGRAREHAAVVGDPLEEFLPLGSGGLEGSVVAPDGQPEVVRTQDREDGAVLRWTETDAAGLYRATLGQHPREFLFAVNVPTATDAQQSCESDLSRAGKEDLQGAYPGWEFQLVTDVKDVVRYGGPRTAAGEGPGAGAGVARYLLLAMLALLLAEVILAWRFGHFTSAPGTYNTPTATGRLAPALIGLAAGLPLLLVSVVLLHAARTGDFLSFLPASLRRSVEAGLGIPPPAAGEGTRWALDYTPFLHERSDDVWLAGAVGLAAAALVLLVYRREGSTARAAYKLLLAGLRIGFLFLTLAVLLPQLRLLFERQSWPDVAVLIDDSRSMSSPDQYQDAKVRQAAEQLAKAASLSEPQRLELAKALLLGGDGDWLESLANKLQFKVHVYHCASRAGRVADVTDAADPKQHRAAVEAIKGLQADGESSQLGTAVRQVLNNFRGSSLAAILMLTDGVTTEGEDLGQAAKHAARAGVPLFFVGLGDSHEVRDLKLHDLQAEDTVYVNDRIVFEFRLTGQGYTDLVVPVTLKEKGKDKAIDQQMVRVDPGGKPVKVRLAHKPTEAGERTYIIEAPVQTDEVRPADNNRLEKTVFVRENKLIKILYVEGYARYEFRFIKHLLERESAAPANKTMDLKVVLLEADADYPRQDKSALAEVPSKIELDQFDVVILGDIDPADPKVEKRLDDLADFTRERGGGMLFIAGERFNPHAFKDTPLRDVLPVEVTGPELPDAEHTAGFRPELTPSGRFHPIFRFHPDEAENAAIWNRLAELFWWSECYRAEPGAEVLAVHPLRRLEKRDRLTEADDRHPLIVQQFVGRGRSLFFGIDETWRWRYREDERRFDQFWVQTVRFLARRRLGRTTLELNKQGAYRRGEPIKVTVRFPDDVPPPALDTAVEVKLERRFSRPDEAGEPEEESLRLEKVEGSRSTYEALVTRTPEGDYRFRLGAPEVPGQKPQVECKVLPPPGEMDRLRMNQAELERAAEETHGRFYTLADADRLLGDLPPGSRVALNTSQPPRLLWNHAAVFGFAVFLLGSEWFLRKRKHLL